MSGRGVERILDLIEWFAVSPGEATLAQVAGALDIPKSSALQMLRTLTERGYLERRQSGNYVLNRLPGDLSGGTANWGALLALAGPYIQAAVEVSGESGFLAVLEATEIRYINKILPNREIRYDRDITTSRPAHKVASGVVILAGGDDATIERHAAECELTAEEKRALHRMIDAARRDGFYLNLKGVVEGAAGVAAPVLDASGRVIAAINLSGPQARLSAHSNRICETVLKTARDVSEEVARRVTIKTTGGKV